MCAGMAGNRPKREGPLQADLDFVQQQLAANGAAVPDNFSPTAPSQAQLGRKRGQMPTDIPRNPQTLALMGLIGREYNLDGAVCMCGEDCQQRPSDCPADGICVRASIC